MKHNLLQVNECHCQAAQGGRHVVHGSIHGKFTSFVNTLGVGSNEDHVMPAESLGQCLGLYKDARESMKAHALWQYYYYTSSKNFHSLVAF